MKHYVGVKAVQAERDDRSHDEPGYKVVYPDGYVSWSPKDVFEAAYLPLGDDPTRVDEATVRQFIGGGGRTQMGNHTVICAELRNGFTVVEDSACVDPENYDEALGTRLALEKVKYQTWAYLGFVLAWARNGLWQPNNPESDERNDD